MSTFNSGPSDGGKVRFTESFTASIWRSFRALRGPPMVPRVLVLDQQRVKIADIYV